MKGGFDWFRDEIDLDLLSQCWPPYRTTGTISLGTRPHICLDTDGILYTHNIETIGHVEYLVWLHKKGNVAEVSNH